jgi:D-alanine-D-alanine ligase
MNIGQFGKVAVLYGGTSAERAVSLNSGRAVLATLLRQGVNAIGIDAIGFSLLDRLRNEKVDRCLIMFHGTYGEDGVVQGLLEAIGMPYSGCGILASALGMDKLVSKRIWQSLALKLPAYRLMQHALDYGQLAFPLAIKPHNQGSSVGISKVLVEEALPQAYQLAKKYGEVIAEEWIVGKELTVGIVGQEILPSIWIEPAREFYDYTAKCRAGTTYHCPSGLSEEKEQEIQQLAVSAFHALGGSGWGRVDFIMDNNGELYLIELNTVPGMTELSLVPKAAKENGWSYDDLVLNILESSLP